MRSDDFFLFVSHVSEDERAALQVVHELERKGVRCWIAPRDVRAGVPFDDEIADAIEQCRAMLLIFSNRCNDNEYIRRELPSPAMPIRSSSRFASRKLSRNGRSPFVSPICTGSTGLWRGKKPSIRWCAPCSRQGRRSKRRSRMG